jgi:hypothetical protein
MFLEKYCKYLKIMVICLCILGSAAMAQDTPPVSPQQEMLDAARAAARGGDREAALAHLANLEDSGFAAVGVITGDPVLSKFAGDPVYEELVAAISARAFPCEQDPAFRAFDFWVGDWDVHLADGSLAGVNRITREQHGCILVEDWHSASGNTGMSINYLDKANGEWVQVWNDAGGNQITIRGGPTESGMRLEGTIHYVTGDQTLPFRGLWTTLPDGRLRQFFEQADENGANWTPWFEGFYTSRATGE